MLALKDKVAIVTGAGLGIGRAIALYFTQEGAKVVVNHPGSDASLASEVVRDIEKAGGIATANRDTVTTLEGSEGVLSVALKTFGKLDIVVTCHNVEMDSSIFDMEEEQWEAVLSENLKGTFTVCRSAASIFKNQRSGRIVTLASEAGLIGNSGSANYAAAASAVAGFTKAIARELEEHDATANFIGFGIATGKTSPEDVAPFAAYLASDVPANVNGQTFLVHGMSISLVSQPRLIDTIYKAESLWTVEEFQRVLPDTLVKSLENA